MEIVLIYPVISKAQIGYEAELKKLLPQVKLYPFEYYKNKGKIRSLYFLFRLHRLLVKRVLKQPFLDLPIYQDEYVEFLNRIIVAENIDFVQNEYIEQLYLVYLLPNNVKKVFIHHEIQYIAKERMIAQREYPMSVKYLAKIQKSNEINALNEYDKIITMSKCDQEILERDGVNKPIYSSPSFIPLTPETTFKKTDRNSISFIGGEKHFANLNGMIWFLDEVWPLVLAERPDFQFKIIGKWSPLTIKKFKKQYSNLIFCGFVEDLSSAISDTIMVVPIRMGSGIRMKILEAVNYYIPFVTTKVGVEGLDFENATECIVTDDPNEFAKGILTIASRPVYGEELAINAHKKLEEKYAPEISSQNRFNILINFKL